MVRATIRVRGFALPTVLITSVAMMIVLLAALTAVSSVSSSLKNQYYDKVARLASESGAAMAVSCIQANDEATWTDNSPLQSGTDCTGAGSPGYVLNEGNIRSSFSVNAPTSDADSPIQFITVTSKVELLRTSNGLPWKTSTTVSQTRLGSTAGFESIKFGYTITYDDAYFFTIGKDKKLRAVGGNSQGQLGTGTTANNLTPKEVILPNNVIAKNVFTNFLAIGYTTFVLGNDNNLYASGRNDQGQLGIGSTATTTSFKKVLLPSSSPGRYAAINGVTSFFIGTNNNVYASGGCAYGLLGSNYTISGCSDISTPVRVNLPAPSSSDQNTIPADDIVTDYRTAYLRTNGGRIYGWGNNEYGMLTDGTLTDRSSPVKIGTYGDAGQPTATDIDFNGETLLIADSNFTAKSAGWNQYGQLGQGVQQIRPASYSTQCMRSSGFASGDAIEIFPCSSGTLTLRDWTIDGNGQIKNSNTGMCINILNNGTANGTKIVQIVCGNPLQSNSTWQMRMDGSIYNPASGKCIDNPSNANTNGNDLQLYTCGAGGGGGTSWKLVDSPTLVDYTLPDGVTGNILKISTDQRFSSILLDIDNDGEGDDVYSVGPNESGQLGNGSSGYFQVTPTKFILPSGVKASDVYSTASGGTSSSYQNTFVLGDDGRIYGAGRNTYGQLGDGTTTDRSTPVPMNVIDGNTTRAKQVISGYGTTIVLTTKGKIFTVGRNHDGQLGDGTTTDRSTPSQNDYTNVVTPVTF